MHVGRYLVVAFAFSWLLGLAVAPFRGETSTLALVASNLLTVAYMFGPLVGAVVAQRAAGEKVLRPLGAAGRVNPWWVVAWIAPFLYAFVTLACSLPLPGVELSPDLSGFWERLAGMLPPEQLEEARAEMEGTPRAVFWLMLIGQPLLAGPSINALAAFGEELGWRGYLYRAWAHLGFWRSSLLVGVTWGLWHAPLIAQGHNYPTHPFVGIAMMTVWCTLLGPPFHYLRLRTGSVVAVAIAHGTLNASAGVALLFVRGGSDLVVGMTGLAGFLAAALANLAILLFARDLDLTRDLPPREGAA